MAMSLGNRTLQRKRGGYGRLGRVETGLLSRTLLIGTKGADRSTQARRAVPLYSNPKASGFWYSCLISHISKVRKPVPTKYPRFDVSGREPERRRCAFSGERNTDARFDISLQRDNSNYMSTALKISLTRIGNSRGIRLPAPLIKKFGFDGGILLDEEGDRLVLKPLKRGKAEKLPWSETAREMASAREDWSDWEPSEKDGLQEIPWESSDQRKSQP